MNQVYRVVFNRSLGVWQCVSELAKSQGKSSGKLAKPLVVAMAVISGIGSQSAMAATLSDGQAHDFGTVNYQISGHDIITNAGTVLTAPQLQYDTTQASILDITNQGKVSIANGSFVDSAGQLNIDNANLTSKTIAVGYDGDGTITVKNTGTINTTNLSLGENANSKGTVNLSNQSQINIQPVATTDTTYLSVGRKGNGELNMSSGSTVTVNDYLNVGETSTGVGTVTMTDPNTVLTATKEAHIGYSGNGTMSLANNAKLASNLVFLGDNATATGVLNLDHANLETTQLGIANQGTGTVNLNNQSTANVQGITALGNAIKGIATLNMAGKSVLNTDQLQAGNASTSQSKITINDSTINTKGFALGKVANSQTSMTADNHAIINTQGSVVGVSGQADLTLTNGSQLNSTGGFNIAGLDSNSLSQTTGTVTVDGKDSLINTTSMNVGYKGNGTLNIRNGGQVTVNSNDIALGDTFSGMGQVNIDGTNSKLDATGKILVIGNNGTGTVKVTNGGQIYAGTTVLGNENTGKGVATLDGTNTLLKTDHLNVGYIGNGTLNINN